MNPQIEYRNYRQATIHPATKHLSLRRLSQHIANRVATIPFPVSCILQVDDTRDVSHDYTQLWLSRSGMNQWNRIYQLPLPFAQLDADIPDNNIVELVDRFVKAFADQERNAGDQPFHEVAARDRA